MTLTFFSRSLGSYSFEKAMSAHYLLYQCSDSDQTGIDYWEDMKKLLNFGDNLIFKVTMVTLL